MDVYDRKIKDYKNRYRNLYEMLVHSAERFPAKAAVIDDKEEVTYTEMLRRVDVLSSYLVSRYGIKQDDRIAIVMVNSSDILVSFYAAMKLGVATVLVNTKFRESQITDLIGQMDVSLILSDEMWLDKVNPVANQLRLDVLTLNGLFEGQEEATDIPCTTDPEAAAVILHTSGTTGLPKGIIVTQKNIMEASFGYEEIQGLNCNDITVLSVPIFHILGLSCVSTLFIYMGATIVLSAFFDVDDVITKIKKYKATHFHSVPAVHLQLINSNNPEKDFSSIRVAIIGGAPITPEDVDRVEQQMPNAEIHLAYGMTETAGSGTLSLVHKGRLHAVPNVYMRVVDSDHNDVPVGEVGEIVFGGPCVARGRWKLDPLPDDNEYSGDVGYMDADGYVYILDRVKDIVNRGGEKIFPIQIELQMMKYPGIKAAAVYAVSDRKYGEVPYAAVVPEDGVSLDIENIKTFLRGKISTYETPVHYDIVREFPVTHNGKVRKAELRRIAEERIQKEKEDK